MTINWPVVAVSLPGPYEISTERDRLDLAQVHQWLSTDTYWATGRSLETVERAMETSLNLGVYDAEGTQVGYARVVTDLATFGWLCDVYVSRGHRGNGIGGALAAAARDCLAPYGLRRILLSTDGAQPIYAKAGFTPLPETPEYMQFAY
ncbi:GNAT family N-acetyltransferase [Streptomyces sp. XD-27]|uniref:GNAT family N-acetyltransferase n=1 Tax=Streptomyces sp. XD-27 TaxID=3062779 RepID=UPI0026F46CA7|nr:GNAT family N-acetyltransferase [Streptomyces sp. XD-27]WKX70804.1 GNAT family N-acetyltransferase [Streptomyces sp. XD-27]